MGKKMLERKDDCDWSPKSWEEWAGDAGPLDCGPRMVEAYGRALTKTRVAAERPFCGEPPQSSCMRPSVEFLTFLALQLVFELLFGSIFVALGFIF